MHDSEGEFDTCYIFIEIKRITEKIAQHNKIFHKNA